MEMGMTETERKLQAHLAPDGRNPVRIECSANQYLDTAPRITCADGFSMSVQTGPAAYCQPRDGFGPWNKVEVGFPSAAEPALMEWAEEPNHPTGTVYGYVPVKVIASVIDAHGGFAA